MIIAAIDRFFKHEAAGGIMLMIATVAALAVANSPLAAGYNFILETIGEKERRASRLTRVGPI